MPAFGASVRLRVMVMVMVRVCYFNADIWGQSALEKYSPSRFHRGRPTVHAGYDSWLDTFRCIADNYHDRRNRSPPIVVTSYTREEAEDDFDKCVRACVRACECILGLSRFRAR